MLSNNALIIERTVNAAIPENKVASEHEVLALANGFRAIFPVTDDEFQQVIRLLHSKLQITMDVGTVISNENDEEHQSWLFSAKPDFTPDYWDRYRTFLVKNEGWSPRVVSTLDRVTDEVLDFMGNPLKVGSWKRRGLVMGDVQSGKTATYTGLCCKAADAGYKLIILLTGTLENLRRQTQERLDAGFVGRDSSGILSQQRQNRAVGVGLIDQRPNAGVFTSTKNDFRSELVNQLGITLNSFSGPILVVVKKNKRILENLENWLKDLNADSNNKIHSPLLVIDDEADNASINTVTTGETSAINKRVRSILQLFTRSTYVGFTATPFANIFINPDTEDEMLGDDLFPRDFIYSLEAPSNYVGAESIFSEDGKFASNLREIDDAEDIFPRSHKSSLPVNELPSSLEKALLTFILVNAIRDLRGQATTHRSMLVNVSRFTDVQEQVARIMDERLRQIQQDIRSYSQLVPELASECESIAALKQVWDQEFGKEYADWETIQQTLTKAALPIIVKSVNQRGGAAGLNYSANKESGLRVIAVGGNSLSRGLTLEGLCVSYFYRNSQMYDTLMQMGRWFGYREGYSDICRIWMTGGATHWYSHIALATRELRNEIKTMQQAGQPPKDFGLKVRAHPDSLIVTARNKMRTAQTVERLISLRVQGPETPYLYSDAKTIKTNAAATQRLIRSLNESGNGYLVSDYGGILWSGVPKEYIVSLLNDFIVHPLNYHFQNTSIASLLERSAEEVLNTWDVVIPRGSGDQLMIEGIPCKPQLRKSDFRERTILVSGSSARVSSRGAEREGVNKDKVKQIEEEYKALGKLAPDKKFREVRERPLLLVHIVTAKDENEKYFDTQGIPLIALGLSFPDFDDSKDIQKVKYSVNLVEWHNMFHEEADDDAEDAE